MIFLTLFVVLIFSISSVSSASIDDIDDAQDNKVLKSSGLPSDSCNGKVLKSDASSSNSCNKTVALSTATKVKTKTAKATKTTKKNTTKANSTKTKANTTTVNKKTLAKTSASFMNSVEKNGKFPKVKISNKNYSNTEYLYLISKAVENNSNSKIEMESNLVKPYNNTKHKSVKGTINKTEYVKIAGKTRKFIEKNHRAPNWASSSKGNIPYNQLILLYSKCLDSYNKTNKLPASVKLDSLDLDTIKNKTNKKTAKATSNSTVKKTNTTTAKKTTNSTDKKTNTTTTNKTTNSTVKKTNTTKSTSKNNNTSKVEDKADKSANNGSLVEKSLDYINSILNNILNKLDPSKYQIDISQSDEANVKLNTSKVNVDVNGKSTVNVKVSAKNTKNSTKKTSKATSKKTASKSNKTTAKKATAKTSKATSKKTVSKTNAKTMNNTVSKALKEYLSSSKNCQVNNKQIKELAKTLTSSLKTDYEKGKNLFAWVRDNIQYEKYRNTRKGAVNTLKKKQGNCVDQTHLLVALSRAAGIPARYVNGGNCKFTNGYLGGHVWGQMYINKKWVVADTTSSRNSLGKIRNWNTKSYTLYGKYSSISF